MLLAQVVEVSRQVAQTSKRLEKVQLLAQCLTQLSQDELVVGVNLLAGQLPQGRVGVGWSALSSGERVVAAAQPALTLLEVSQHLDVLGAHSGAGSAQRRTEALGHLLALATADEQDFLRGLLGGGLRQGALEAVVLDAVARAWRVPLAAVRHAHMFAADLGAVARAAQQGEPALRAFSLRVFQPVLPMLAHPADGVQDALGQLGTASLELKLDGARVQVHRLGDDVRIFSRELNDVTLALPEVVAAARAMPGNSWIVDGEVVAIRPDGTPHPFQTTMRRFGRKQVDEALCAELPVRAWLFDCLLLDGNSLVEQDTSARFEALAAHVSPELLIPRLVTADVAQASAFLADALQRGHEGIMAKSLTGPYQAGKRGAQWLKIKKVHTLDLVVLAVEWGSGRRSGMLSNIHLGARDAVHGGFVMLGKTFKGMTDEMLRWQTQRFLELEVAREGHVVHVRPEQVVEVAFNDVQVSSTYPGGMALRLARVTRYRPDKTAAAADTVDAVRALLPRP